MLTRFILLAILGISNEAGDKLVDIITPANGSRKSILKTIVTQRMKINTAWALQLWIKLKCKTSLELLCMLLFQLHQQKQMSRQAIVNHLKEPSRCHLVYYHVEKGQKMCSAMIYQLEQRIHLKQDSLVTRELITGIPLVKCGRGSLSSKVYMVPSQQSIVV